METIEVTLRSGGVICLQVELDWLTVPIDDVEFVRELVGNVKAYDAGETPAAPAAPKGRQAPAKASSSSPVKPSTRGRISYPRDEVARVANAAAAAGKSARAAVAERFGVPVSTADQLIYTARKAGHAIAGRSNASSAATAAKPAGFTPADTLRIIEGGNPHGAAYTGTD
jgi:hypothetical protein